MFMFAGVQAQVSWSCTEVMWCSMACARSG